MKKFSYEAKDTTTGKRVKSTVQADSELSAAKLLSDQGFVPLDIREKSAQNNILERLTGRITTKDKIVFSRQLATLLGAGLPLTQGLHTVADQTQNSKLQSIIGDILVDIESGKTLYSAFSKHPETFSKVFLSLIQAGEASGSLDDSLRRIAEQQEKDAAVVSKIRGALTYPVIVLVVIFGVLIFMLLAVVPQTEKLYEDMGKKLPFMTQLLVSTADFIANYWYLVVVVTAIAAYFFAQYIKTTNGIKFMDSLKLNVPIFKGLFRKLYMARFARTSQTLLDTGVPMLDTLKITGEAVNNTIIQAGVDRAADKVKGGKQLSASLVSEEYFLALVPQMIKIGEQSGQMGDMLGKVAQVYDDELDEQIKTISTLIEPVLMVFLALTVGGIISAVLFPIYSLVNSVGI